MRKKRKVKIKKKSAGGGGRVQSPLAMHDVTLLDTYTVPTLTRRGTVLRNIHVSIKRAKESFDTYDLISFN